MIRYFVKLKWKLDGGTMDVIISARNEHHAVWKAKESFSDYCDTEDLELVECRHSTLEDEPEIN